MTYTFYTIFDTEFLAKGLALHDSLVRHCPGGFTLWVLCLDDKCFSILKELGLANTRFLSLQDIEDADLLEAKKTRTLREYSWTMKPSVANFLFTTYPNIETLFYLDSDIYFYHSPQPIYEEFEGHSVILFPHRLQGGKQAKENDVGKYNAGMIMFRNDTNGRACLEWWRQKCNEWCYHKEEPGRLGDQKYLDYFAEQFEGILVSKNLGVDVAPWNVKNYRGTIKKQNGTIMALGTPLICFHFSLFNFYYPSRFILPNGPTTSFDYTLPAPEKTLMYDEYIHKIFKEMKRIQKIRPGFKEGSKPRPNMFKQIRQDVVPLIRTLLRGSVGAGRS
ncbi:MAG: hypothetical protein JWN89_734 [Parcubacteria group bacterium]|nr:hypothetical protein [Parcubacteria group bacterium]